MNDIGPYNHQSSLISGITLFCWLTSIVLFRCSRQYAQQLCIWRLATSSLLLPVIGKKKDTLQTNQR